MKCKRYQLNLRQLQLHKPYFAISILQLALFLLLSIMLNLRGFKNLGGLNKASP